MTVGEEVPKTRELVRCPNLRDAPGKHPKPVRALLVVGRVRRDRYVIGDRRDLLRDR